MRIYECPVHDQAFEENDGNCAICTNICRILRHNEEVKKRTVRVPRLRESVCWPKTKDLVDGGRVIEHLDHKPVFVRSKDHFRDELKRRGLQEAG